MAVSFPSKIAFSVNDPFSIILPIAADRVTIAVFKRLVSEDKARFAGSIAGIGTLCFLGKQASLAISLTGAALYLLYKVVISFNFSFKPNLDAALQDIEKELSKTEKAFSYISNKELDALDPEFDNQFAELLTEIVAETNVLRSLWENPEFLPSIHLIMISCRTLLITIRGLLQLETTDLQHNPEARLQKIAMLLQDPNHVVEKQIFDKAFSLFNKIYRMVRCKGYVVTLPNVRNSPKGHDFYVTNVTITEEYADLFFQHGTPQSAMLMIFNTTQDNLADLLQLLYPDSPLTAKDEVYIPGDYGSPDNPFKIRIFDSLII
jgi:hypothetical protein